MMYKRKTLRNIIALLLCFLMATGAAMPAFAMDDYDLYDDFISSNDYDDYLLDVNKVGSVQSLNNKSNLLNQQLNDANAINDLGKYTKYDEFLLDYVKHKNIGLFDEKAAVALDDWANLSTAFSIFTGISSIVCMVSSAISLLQMMGVVKGEPDPSVAVMQQLGTLKSSVDELDRKVDAIQDTLVNEFAELDLKLQNQDYNHYKDDVWAKFYTDAVVPLNNIQTEYSIRVNDLLLEYIDLWQKGENKTDLRALMGRNEENGEIMQVYSGRNLRDPGKALPIAPEVSLDGLPVEYTIVLPAEYITANIDKEAYLTSDNCIAVMRDALTKGVYQAAEKGELTAYYGFENEWLHFSEEEKQAAATEFAGNLADALTFACSYNAVNEKGFTSSVRNAYLNFTKWLQGSESLTSPLTAQLKMLSLSHVFEGEITESVDEITFYLCLMNQSFYNFTQSMLSMSKSHSKDQMLEVSNAYYTSEIIMSADYTNFITGNPNYCYVTGSVIEYKDLTLESTMKSYHVQFDNSDFIEENENTQYAIPEGFTKTGWKMYEKGTPDSQKEASQEDLMARTVTPKQAKIIYAMYETAKTGIDFSNFLVANNVAATTQQISRSGIITSVDTENFDMSKASIKMTCYLPSNHGTYAYTPGRQYTVKSGVAGDLNVDSNFLLHDMATGGLFDLTTGDFNENAPLEYRVYYHGTRTDSAGKPYSVHRLIAFSTTDFSSKDTELGYNHPEVQALGGTYYKDYSNIARTESVFTSDRYGMLVSSELSTYTFTVNTKEIGSQYFGKTVNIDKIVFNGTPESIADDAFEGVGSTDSRCLLSAPFATGSLVGKWHGGYFGNIQLTAEKNDNSGEKETVVAASGEKVNDVVCPFTAPEYAIFDGWSYYPNGAAVDPDDTISTGITLYARWKFDHEHDFEVTKEGVAPTCTKDGCTEEKTCKICGYKDIEILPATGHSCEYYKDTVTGEYIAECSQHDYYAHLYPRTCGLQTVWSENKTGDDISYISGTPGVTCIKEDGVYVIESFEPPFAFMDDAQAVYVKDGVNADICFAGVKLTGNANANGLDIGKANVHLTLNGENTITGEQSSAISCAGNLTIDGKGTLNVTGDNTCAPMACTGEKTVINGGCISVQGGISYSIDINENITGGKLVITQNAGVKAWNGIDAVPVNEKGERVYPATISNFNFDTITVDGEDLPHWVTNEEDGNAYIYLTAKDHEITVDGEHVDFEPFNEEGYSEKQYGDFTVLNSTFDPNAVSFESGVLTVKKSSPITIKNTNPDTATHNRIEILPSVDANITLAGVNIDSRDVGGSAISIGLGYGGNAQSGKVKITLAEDTENILHGSAAGIYLAGNNGLLIIDGEGTLYATGEHDSAGIGSSENRPLLGDIIINGGTIYATAGSYFNFTGSQAAAIGSGKINAGSAIVSDYAAGNITINGGTVYANASQAPAVGAGICEKNLPSKTITINGGMLIASSDAGEYTIGDSKTEGVTINGGIVTTSTRTEGKGGIISAKTVIENTASVKANRVESPINSMGKDVSLNVIQIGDNSDIYLNGKGYRSIGHNGESKIYLYLAEDDRLTKIPHVECEIGDRGVVICSPAYPKPGDEVTLIPAAHKGYSFVDYDITPAVEIKNDTFIMPNTPLTIKGIFARFGTVTVTESEHGKVMPSKSLVLSGETVTLRAIPDEGYELDTLTVTPVSLEANGKSFIMPEEDVTVTCTFKEKTNTVTWNVDGETTSTDVVFGHEIVKPTDPSKSGFIFKGWTPEIPESMPDANLEFFAVFEPITYTATFVVDGTEIGSVEYNLTMDKLDEPAVPQKIGYTGAWKAYTLAPGGITVEAEYTAIEYTARFIANGELVEKVTYTLDTVSITEPAVPEKAGYVGVWSEYTLPAGGVIIKAVYTPDVHEHTFDTKYSRNEVAHWFASTCGHDVASHLEEHSFSKGVVKGDTVEYTCTVCNYVKTVTETEDGLAKALIDAITAAENAIDSITKDGDDALKAYAEEAKTEIGKATTGSEVTKKLAEAIETINQMKTEKAAEDALDTLDKVTASTSKGQSIVRMAKLLVNEAKSAEEISAILTDALTKLEAEESAVADVTEAKNEAKEAIAEKAGEKQSDEMKSIIADVEAVIDAAETAEQVAAAQKLGEATVQMQLDKEAADAALEEAKTSLAEAQSALTETQKSLAEKTEALEAAKGKLKEANEALEQAKKDLETAEGDIKAKTEALEAAEKSLADAQAELDETKKELSEKSTALTAAQADLAAANESLEKANKQVEDLNEELDKVKDELAGYYTELTTAKAQVESLSASLTNAQDELMETRGDLAAANEQVTALTADLEKANKDLAEANKELAAAKAEVTSLTADLNKANSDLAEANKELDAAKAQVTSLTADLNDAQKELADTKTDLANANKQITALESELEKAKSDLTQANNALSKAQSDLEKAESEKAALAKQLEAKEAELDALKKSSTAKDEEIAALQKSVDELNAAVKSKDEEIAAKAKTVADLEKSVDELEKTVDDKNKEIAEKANTIAALEKSVDELEKTVEDKNKEIAAKANTIAALEKSVSDLEKTVDDKNREISEKANTIAALEKSVDELEKAVKAKDDELAAKENEIAALEKSISELENEVKEKEDEIAEKEKTIGDLEKSVANLEASVQAKETEVAEKTEEIKKLEKNIENLEDEIADAHEDIEKKTSQVEELTEQLEEAKAEIEELKGGPSGHDDGICSKCGKTHKDNFFGKIVCFFNRIGNFFRGLFQKK